MADTSSFQPKLTTPEGIRLEKAAYYMLSLCIGVSVHSKKEYGGSIYRNTKTSKIRASGPFEGTTISVDVGQSKPRFGANDDEVVIAFYHTHPLKELTLFPKGDNRNDLMWDKFEGGDRGISEDWTMPGYLATMDGRCWRFDPAPDPQPDPETLKIPKRGQGTFGVVNFKILDTGSKVLLPVRIKEW